MQVPNIYHLLLGLPFKVNSQQASVFFDCKIRRLFIHVERSEDAVQDERIEEEAEKPPGFGIFTDAPKAEPKAAEAAPAKKDDAPAAEDDEVVEIDTDEVFGRGDTGKVQTVYEEKKPVETEDLENDMLYDLM